MTYSMDSERMFDDLFTTYSNLDPPPIKRATDILSNLDNETINPNIYNMVAAVDSPDINKETDLENIPNPFAFLTDSPHFLPQVERLELNSDSIIDLQVTLKGPKLFEEAFEEAARIDPNIYKYKNFLVRTAKKESDFNSTILNTAGAPYYGYFQMGKNEIAVTTKLSVELFRRNPVAQILGACKLYEMNLNTLKRIGVYNLGKEKGFSDDALVAGAWLGGPGGVKKYLKGLGDPSDSHWYKGKGGTSVSRRMNEFNNK